MFVWLALLNFLRSFAIGRGPAPTAVSITAPLLSLLPLPFFSSCSLLLHSFSKLKAAQGGAHCI